MPVTSRRSLAARWPLLLAAALFASGCAEGSDSADEGGPGSATTTTAGASSSATSSESSPAEETSDAALEVRVRVRDGEVSPSPRRVEVVQGEPVRLTVTSDVADELHVHGADVEATLRPGRPAVLEFTVEEQGVFEVETHESGLLLLQLEVR